jgi:uncharacterized protein UPF0547
MAEREREIGAGHLGPVVGNAAAMKCPYCAEEIKDDAVVCRHCGHDFSLLKPLLARVIALEHHVQGLEDAAPSQPAAPAPLEALAAVIAVTLCIVITSGYFLVALDPPIDERPLPYVFAIVLPPTLLGALVGFTWRRNWRAYLAAGLALGILNLTCIALVFSSFEGAAFKWVLAVVTFIFGQPLTFATSGLLANSLRSRWLPLTAGERRRGDEERSLTTRFALAVELLKQIVALAGTILSAIALVRGALK